MDIVFSAAFVLAVTTLGYGKLTPIDEYPRQNRAGRGVRTFKITEKTGEVTATGLVSHSQQVMIISAKGIVICTPAKEDDPRLGITIQGRSTQGVRLMRLDQDDKVVAIAYF
jgi:DNA gyrase subunit A